ncbi:MAG: PocR ligand-binding domain-containing protein [Lachnospiraceae bacterium]|nr:PocR ligand-binding domain-containing protein [Lachnospiraceae bacterium]
MNNEITLTDLFEVEMLQRLQDSFSKMTGFAAIITDAEGVPVTKGTNFTDFCNKYTRTSPIGCLRCQQCDKHGAELALKVGSSVTYYCHAGLMDFAAPIMAGDKMVGCFVGGQVLTSPPDITRIMQVAAEIGIDLINYLQSVMSVPIIEKNKLENAALFLYTLTSALSSIAYHKYIIKEANIEIEKAANMKSDFLANTSHELRTPMNAIIGMTEMALREEMTPTAKKYINQIKAAGKSLLTIINDILDFSKIESGKMDIVTADYEPASMINDIATIISTRIDNDDVELVLDINPDIPRVLYGDSIRIKQIITNLANNAAKFTKVGQICLKYDFEQISEDTINLLFSVSDTGIGIKTEDIEKLFKSFQQVDSKRNRNIEGTGLGLAISKQLVTLMNGDITVESVYGEGSTFSFTIPQKVIDADSSIALSENPACHAVGFLDNTYAQVQLKRDMHKLDIDYTDLKDADVLSYLRDHVDSLKDIYLFVPSKNFSQELQDFVSAHPELNTIVTIPHDTSADYNTANIMVVHKPLSVLSLAGIYNHEIFSQPESLSSDEYYDFTAETAKILIVDDNSINLTVAQGLLEPLNMQIDTALSGNAAISKISDSMYDLILMDHMMPELDGVETTRIIRRFHSEYDAVPIIALTANVIGDVKTMFIKEGMNDFVAKPIEVRMLINTIRKWLPKEKIKKRSGPTRLAPTKKKVILPDIPELNIRGALELLGSEDLFMTILADYYHAIPKKLKLIQTYKDKAEWHNYTIEVHALKSASKQIGADELSNRAAALEAAGNANDIDIILQNTDDMLSMYAHYHDILNPFFQEKPEAEGKPPITASVLTDVFAEMQQAINDLDMDRMDDAIHTLDGYSFDDESHELYIKLCEAVADMDPDACEEVIGNWREIIQ